MRAAGKWLRRAAHPGALSPASAGRAILLAALVSCQACTAVDAAGDGDIAPGDAPAQFTAAGAVEGERRGVAWVTQDTSSRGHLFIIHVANSRVESEQAWGLRLMAMSQTGDPPPPGEYAIVSETDPSLGYAGGFTARFTDIVENRGSRYAHMALEYDMPEEWKGHGLEGRLVIEQVDSRELTGRFELELMEGASINEAPRREEKVLRVGDGRFTAVMPGS